MVDLLDEHVLVLCRLFERAGLLLELHISRALRRSFSASTSWTASCSMMRASVASKVSASWLTTQIVPERSLARVVDRNDQPLDDRRAGVVEIGEQPGRPRDENAVVAVEA